MPDDLDLTGTIVLVTGASRGLGRALAEAYARSGARVAMCSRGPEALEAAADEIRDETGADILARPADVTDADAVDALVRAIDDRWGAVTALVNNAGLLGDREALRTYSVDTWRAVMDVNVTGTLIPSQAVLPGMRARGTGSIVNVTSGVGNRPRADWGAYAVSKWAVEGLTYNMAEEEADAGIRVNTVDPGGLRTEMRHAAYPEEDPNTLPEPREVTGVFLWLASEASAEVTGQRYQAQTWTPDRS